MTHFTDFTLDATNTYTVNEDGEVAWFCERVEVTDVYRDIVTGRRKVKVKVTFSDNTFETIIVKRKLLVDGILSELCDVGLSLPDIREYRETLSEILMETEKTATQHFVHWRLGFHKNKKSKLCFLSAESIGSKEKSTHLEYERYKSKGSLEEWQAGVKPYVDERPELQLATLISLSAPVSTLLSMHGALYTTLIYALIGSSSTGKTTCLRYMCGLWCRPSTVDGGIDLLTDTDNYMLAMLAQKNGFPQFYDDTSTMPDKDFTKLIYTIASSKERGRCNSDGTPREKRAWSGSVVFTGEQSMLSCNEKFTGRSARLIEFNEAWTKDAESAEKLSAVCNRYYGTAHVAFIKHLCKQGYKLLNKRFETAVSLLCDKLEISNGVQRRQVQMFAVLMVTLMYANEVFDFEFDSEAIEALIVKTYKANSIQEPEADRLYNALLQKALANRDKFIRKGSRGSSFTSAWGEEGDYKQHPCFWISSKKFTDFLKDEGYMDVNYAAKILAEAKYIAKFGDRYKKRHSVGGIDTTCYVLFKNAFTPVSKKTKKKSSFDTSKSQFSTLVSDKKADATEV